MQTLLFNPRPIVLSDGQIRREPTRPPELRPPDFAEQFDYDTLLFDSFFGRDNEVVITAPPFYNLLPFLTRMHVSAVPSGRQCSFRIRNIDRHAQIRIAVPDDTTKVLLDSEIGKFDLEPQQNLSGFFANQRVLFTLSKNNRFEWIRDWIRYNRDVHGANAVLIYDNQSTDYSARELLAALSGLSGIDRLCIVDWPFRYGPQGLAYNRHWDSDFCQCGVWEHARWMFLQQARSAMNSDIDELVVSKDGSSVFEAAERSRSGVVRYHGHWVHGIQGVTRVASDQSPIRVVDFDHYMRHSTVYRWGLVPTRDWKTVCPPKWTVVPSRCPDHAQWAPHRIKGWLRATPLSRNFSFRHFREIGNHWKYDRSAREIFDQNRDVFDQRMCANFALVQWHDGGADEHKADQHSSLPASHFPGFYAAPYKGALHKSLSGKLSRFLARNIATKKLVMRNTNPLVSFTFDDAAATACSAGASLLEQYQARGTFYISGAICGASSPTGRLATAEQVKALHARGHEIGCHTYSHTPVAEISREVIAIEIERNRSFLQDLIGNFPFRHFAYPYGAISFRSKRYLGEWFDSCRSQTRGVNAGVADLAALKSYALEDASIDRQGILETIGETVRRNGWVLFASHDVDDEPSRFGVRPGLLAFALRSAQEAGCQLVTVSQALRMLRGTAPQTAAAPQIDNGKAKSLIPN
jgi:peptidoglycan/xylan/chitin deacetylase (PgdA/CDA1 family)